MKMFEILQENLTIPCVKWRPVEICCMTQGTQTEALYQPRGVGDGREAQEGGDICMPMADPCCYMAETRILQLSFN